MTTTLKLYAGKQAPDYCTLPTIDVEILSEFECATCGGEIQYNPETRSWEHDPAEFRCEGHEPQPESNDVAGAEVFCDGTCRTDRHKPVLKPVCAYCGGTDVETKLHAWYDATECSRCGGIAGYALGD